MKLFLSFTGVLLTALSHSICCIIPSLTLVLGTSSSLLSLHFLEDYKFLFLALNIGLLTITFYNLYMRKRSDDACSCTNHKEEKNHSNKKKVFWIAAAFSLALLAIPLFEDKSNGEAETSHQKEFADIHQH